ncbi:Sodium/hydrogen exchanger [Penicillium malachiteum]|uniref:Sodium/hydrogen exchanger n=1 Tax=Penicillium malachiteum TaxID=1324776 RepID=UPI0025484F0A|nr:Sodium/hydrogen exchanger [Penicillium malachiteum]KAJ5721387.1 Sodium/hydrogen exchanger [Penicillium malachiteum]
MAADILDAAFGYEEPTITTLLNQTGFLLILNIINVCLDKLLYCGLVGQLFVGILWGTPGAKWLSRDTETVIQQLGYIGLIMLVYEGGLSTSIKSMKANLLVSLSVALTGIGAPIGLSFSLMKLISATPLQAFAAGAALSATSLGTTFTILSTTKLIDTRLGTVTTSAAMLDDVVGLIMVQIISNLGGDASSFTAVTVIRPLLVSVGFAVGLFILCNFCLEPILKRVFALREHFPNFMGTIRFAFLFQTAVLVGMVAAGTFAGTSSLFAAYLAGVLISWFDELSVRHMSSTHTEISSNRQPSSGVLTETTSQTRSHNADMHKADRTRESTDPSAIDNTTTGRKVYEKYYKEPVGRILIPFFFASIGFAIPITEMFQGRVVWRGLIYAILMIIGKMLTGLWLVRLNLSPISNLISSIKTHSPSILFRCTTSLCGGQVQQKPLGTTDHSTVQSPVATTHSERKQRPDANKQSEPQNDSSSDRQNPSASGSDPQTPSGHPNAISSPPRPKSLYPAALLGLAMVARGEVGYLIASLAESQGIFSSESNEGISDIYLVVIWGISICTLVGPISVGTLVKRVEKLQRSREFSGVDPLGAWGI